jgi:ATP-dependent Clp protease adaptor protein ClpS
MAKGGNQEDGSTGIGTKAAPRTRMRLAPPSLWKVILHNDDYTTQDFVVMVLQRVFRKPETEAVSIMMDVHRKGAGVAGVYPYDVADTKVAQVRALAEAQEFPLLCTLEPEA